jgi:hypothetical protein
MSMMETGYKAYWNGTAVPKNLTEAELKLWWKGWFNGDRESARRLERAYDD